MRELCRCDLYFLLRYILSRPDVEKDWVFDRCREVQNEPDGHLDLWAREHFKSTIITFGKTIQDILSSHGENPLPEWDGREVTVGIFSHTNTIAKAFLDQIKKEFERNAQLKALFPDILYENPQKEAPKWSLDHGIIVKRKGNPKEATIESSGLVDGQPTSKHYLLMVYDDVVVQTSVGTVAMMKKTELAWENSLNLGVREGGRFRYAGTRYHRNDAYKEIIKRNVAIERKHPITDNGKIDGKPVLFSQEAFEESKKQGSYTFSCQMLLDPTADAIQAFKEEWLKFYTAEQDGKGMNIYILVDPANEKKFSSDYTAMIVVGAHVDGLLYILDMVRDRLSLSERTKKLFELHRKWNHPGQKIVVGYEKYGKDADIAHIEEKMEDVNYRFSIEELGGRMSKLDRIGRIIPDFEFQKIRLPETLAYVTTEKKLVDLVKIFIEEEYMTFPLPEHDDMLDALARIKDVDVKFPLAKPVKQYRVPDLQPF